MEAENEGEGDEEKSRDRKGKGRKRNERGRRKGRTRQKERKEGQVEKGSEFLKSIEGRGMVERTKDREKPGVAGNFRRRYFHGDLDLRLDGPQTIEERRNMDGAPPTGRVEKGRGDRGMED